jgi:hypothetical protein
MSETIFVAQDSNGFVAAFFDFDKLTIALQKYSDCGIPFILTTYKVDITEFVYVISYDTINSVAFVTNDINEAQRVQEIYARVGFVCSDDVKFWKSPVNQIIEAAERRLELAIKPYNKKKVDEDISNFIDLIHIDSKISSL